jgi:hypothetical protein
MNTLTRIRTVLGEKVLSPGFNPEHNKYREHHRGEIHNMLRKTYSDIGGYGGLGSGSKAESDSIHHDITHTNIKMTKRDGKLTTVNLYRDQHGRKSVASGTDGTNQGKRDFLKNKKEDLAQKRAWGEVSGKPEHLMRKLGAPVIDPKHVHGLTGKTITPHPDGEHYTRDIGGHLHTKIAFGYPKKSS